MLKGYAKEKMKIIGNNYQKARISNGKTQEEVAEALDLSPSYISDIERGKSIGSLHTLISLCNFYKVSPNNILNPLIDINTELINPLILGFDSLNQENKEIISEMIRILNEKQVR